MNKWALQKMKILTSTDTQINKKKKKKLTKCKQSHYNKKKLKFHSRIFTGLSVDVRLGSVEQLIQTKFYIIQTQFFKFIRMKDQNKKKQKAKGNNL